MRIQLLALALCAVNLYAQTAVELKQVSMKKWHIGYAQYSGITHLGENRYAVVSDKEPTDGFFLFRIDQNASSGKVTTVYLEGFKGNKNPKVDANGISTRDCEGIAYVPETNTVFISGEGDQRIMEYDMDGQPTGRETNVPAIFSRSNIFPNYGFEALSYDPTAQRLWTTTEGMLPIDGQTASPVSPGVQNLLRIQAFNHELQPVAQYAYRMDRGKTEDFGKIYVYGVPTITALPDGRLLVLEREADITAGGLSSSVRCKLYLVNPSEGHQIDSSVNLSMLDPNKFLIKKLLADWHTAAQPIKMNFANYEGMCLGRKLNDGRQTLLLISDSQGGKKKGPYELKDYIKVIILGE